MQDLNYSLLSYQKKAVDKLIRLKVGALFMEQGTGKTITTLEIARVRLERGKIDRIIWLCPCSAKENIKKEILKICHTSMLGFFTICGIETLSTSIAANTYLRQLCTKYRCFLVVDESLLTKNPLAYRTKNIINLSALCDYKIILNGTPVTKNECDLYSQFYILDWRILGYKSFWSFSANHCEYDDRGKLRKVFNTEHLVSKISPYTFQITKKECLNLPCKTYDTQYFSLTLKQEYEYERVANALLMEIDEMRPETIFRLFSALQAVISGKKIRFLKKNHYECIDFFDNYYDNPRIIKLLEILEDTNEKFIIFCKYESEISQLCTILKDSVRFDGKISQKQRNESLKAFKNGKKYLIANHSCASFSLNLQFCNNIIYFSNDWDLGKRVQSEDRIHRIGQEKSVFITDLCCVNTIDERILDCLNRKIRILDSIKEDIKNAEIHSKLKEEYIYGNKKLFQLEEI